MIGSASPDTGHPVRENSYARTREMPLKRTGFVHPVMPIMKQNRVLPQNTDITEAGQNLLRPEISDSGKCSNTVPCPEEEQNSSYKTLGIPPTPTDICLKDKECPRSKKSSLNPQKHEFRERACHENPKQQSFFTRAPGLRDSKRSQPPTGHELQAGQFFCHPGLTCSKKILGRPQYTPALPPRVWPRCKRVLKPEHFQALE
ncbi:hypothetical protein TNIN_287121 [Trichonephila inaurata madagascariensis]|uniref:Uncharacterized protein n=1 Tax=Trichonephila inaurata madagascariensis TaxID=2747483 RepID=A0A8X6XRA2_9ARAC|nr:hypothetical protein TNIN_287121 [Trichonephila inaurata madagascariensis]